VGFYPGIERWASLDQQQKLQKYVQKAIKQKRTLLIYDEVGKQVRWLQYALEKAGAKNYYFMHKGAKGYYKELLALDSK
jgi:rhodanese-related sulfurtransferase